MMTAARVLIEGCSCLNTWPAVTCTTLQVQIFCGPNDARVCAETYQLVEEAAPCEPAREEKYSLGNIVVWTLHVSSAVAYMHSHKLMHRNIKLRNILLDETQRSAKLASFELAVSTERSRSNTLHIGTLNYMAPEVCKLQFVIEFARLHSISHYYLFSGARQRRLH